MLVGGIKSPTLVDVNVGSRRHPGAYGAGAFGAGAFGASGASSGSPTAPGRAVIALKPAGDVPSAGVWTGRPSAPFLAHLIATDQHAPQTRERRRAEPADAAGVYAAAGAPMPPLGRVLAKSM